MNQIETVARSLKSAILRYVANDIYAHDLDEDELVAIAEDTIAVMPVQTEPVAWHSPLGGLIEARQIAQQAYKDIEREKSINGHIAGKPYDVALSALNSVLGCLAVLVDPTPPAGGSDAE